MMFRRYAEVPHTADLAAKVMGGTIERLFENAAFAMFDMMARIKDVKPLHKITLAISAPDTDALLIKWLNELLYSSYENGMLFNKFKVMSIEGGRLVGEAYGDKVVKDSSSIKNEIKAATHHDVRIKKALWQYEVVVVFDV